MSLGGAFEFLFCPEGRVFVHNDCPGGGGFSPFKSCPRGMVLDEIGIPFCKKSGIEKIFSSDST